MLLIDLLEHKPDRTVFAKIQKLYDQGLTYKQIAAETGENETRISSLITKYLIDRERRQIPISAEEKEELKAFLDKNLTNQEISWEMGKSIRSVEGLIRRYFPLHSGRQRRAPRPVLTYSDEIVQKISDLLDTKIGYKEIADKLGLNTTTVQSIITRRLPNRRRRKTT